MIRTWGLLSRHSPFLRQRLARGFPIGNSVVARFSMQDQGVKSVLALLLSGAITAVAGHAAQHGHPRKSLLAQQFDNRFIKRLAMPFVRLADVNAHQRAL